MKLPVLSANNLKKDYLLGFHHVRALNSVSFSIERGEFVAIMGPSGSGKSTMLHLLGGLDRPSSGEVTLAGQAISLLSDRQATLVRRRNVGFVFQFFNLLPTLTAEENILLPLIIDGKKLETYQERLENLLILIGLSDRRWHKPDQLSGGEQQRVALARALITEPAVLLADEPTGNLDSKTGAAMMELLRMSCKDLNQAIIMVTHDPRAASFADRIVFLRDGQETNCLVFPTDITQTNRLRLVIEALEQLET
ncbi:MAG: ABC transporter ATP-binding protein [Anaerolineaceae bacterium]|nr:ABC transporter ATP-binding protein [Anaerolineaceae bacterium]